MKINPLPSIEVLNSLLNYDPATGDLTWKKNRGKVKAGDIAGSVNKAGYRLISIRQNGKVCNYMAHRIAWALYHGEDPYPEEIDHRNQNRGDNAIDNLRLATRTVNLLNMRVKNPTGVAGLQPHKGGWQVTYRNRYVGWTKDLTEAEAMRARAQRCDT